MHYTDPSTNDYKDCTRATRVIMVVQAPSFHNELLFCGSLTPKSLIKSLVSSFFFWGIKLEVEPAAALIR